MRITGQTDEGATVTIVWTPEEGFTDDPTGLIAPMIEAGTDVQSTATGPWLKAAATPDYVALVTAQAVLDEVTLVEDADAATLALQAICTVPEGALA